MVDSVALPLQCARLRGRPLHKFRLGIRAQQLAEHENAMHAISCASGTTDHHRGCIARPHGRCDTAPPLRMCKWQQISFAPRPTCREPDRGKSSRIKFVTAQAVGVGRRIGSRRHQALATVAPAVNGERRRRLGRRAARMYEATVTTATGIVSHTCWWKRVITSRCLRQPRYSVPPRSPGQDHCLRAHLGSPTLAGDSSHWCLSTLPRRPPPRRPAADPHPSHDSAAGKSHEKPSSHMSARRFVARASNKASTTRVS